LVLCHFDRYAFYKKAFLQIGILIFDAGTEENTTTTPIHSRTILQTNLLQQLIKLVCQEKISLMTLKSEKQTLYDLETWAIWACAKVPEFLKKVY
jgi:hypothetical protein